MNKDELHGELISLKAEASKEYEYTLYKFGSTDDSSLLLLVYIYDDNEASFTFEVKSDPELYTANKAYEKIDFESESDLFIHLYNDISQALNQGIECHSKNGIFFHHSKALLASSKICLFGSSAFRFGNFKIPKKQGIIGIFKVAA